MQILFIALKLDNIIDWQWLSVVMPSWIIVIVILTCCLGIVCHLSLNYLRRNYRLGGFLNTEAHPNHQFDPTINFSFSDMSGLSKPLQFLSCCLIILVPIILFLIMLVVRLDNPELKLPYVIIFAPLIIAVLMMFLLSCCSVNDSKWWFGIKYDYCTFLLLIFPELRFLANISCFMVEPGSSSGDDSDFQPDVQHLGQEKLETKIMTEEKIYELKMDKIFSQSTQLADGEGIKGYPSICVEDQPKSKKLSQFLGKFVSNKQKNVEDDENYNLEIKSKDINFLEVD